MVEEVVEAELRMREGREGGKGMVVVGWGSAWGVEIEG